MTTSTPQPRPHQLQALTDLTAALALHDRTQLIMACGTGKTLVGRWHAQASDAEQILVLLPSLALVSQTLREWRRATGQVNTGWRFRAMVVCSDPTTTEGIAERGLEDDGETVPSTVWSTAQARVTTDPAVAARFMREHTPGQPQVIFSTYHSSPVIAQAQRAAGDAHRFDLVLCDEAHRLAGRPSDAFATVLDPRQVVARKRVFMTATPKAFAGEGHSMDNPAVFGPVSHTVTFGDAIAVGLLTDYQVLVVAGRGSDAEAGESVPAVLAKAIDGHNLQRVLTFHGRVAKAEAFATAIDGHQTPGGRQLAARHVSGSMRTSRRVETINWLGEPDVDPGAVRLVSNARCLSEGVDVPAVDGLLFADQRSSVVDVLQAVGRVLRTSPGKNIGTIVLPVTLPEDSDDDTSLLLDKAFSNVWTVLRSLRAHDQRLATEFDEAAREIARRPGANHHGGWRIPRVQFVFPDGVDMPNLELRAVREIGTMWSRNLGLLQAWAEANNGKLVPRGAKALDGTVNIGEWCEQQRIARRRGLLDTDRTQLLEAVPGWSWDKADTWWRDTYQLLVEYAGEHGTVADHHTGESRFAGMYNREHPRRHLGVWMAAQRQAFRLGTLSADYQQLLETLPGWAWDGGLPEVDVEHVEALRQFVEFEKHANVPAGHIEDGLRLDAWCWAVRRRKLTGHLSPVLEDEILAATPSKDRPATRFQWEKNETLWRLGYFALQQYAARESNATPPASHREQLPDTDVGLGQWGALQRFKHRQGRLEERFVALLEAVPGWVWEVELKTVEAAEPVNLTGFATEHGRPGAWSRPHFCKCEVCLAAKRASQNNAARRKAPRLTDPVPVGEVRAHVTDLEQLVVEHMGNVGHVTRNGRTLMAAVADVPLGMLRKLSNGTLEEIERAHRDRLLALSLEDVLSSSTAEGSRGRTVSSLTAQVDSGPTLALFDDLAARGFSATWVGRELGYHGAPQIRRGRTVQLRIAKSVAELHTRVGDLVMPPLSRSTPKPSLAELRATHAREQVAS